jgi:chromate reductase
MKKVAVLIGSLRKNSLNRALYNYYKTNLSNEIDMYEVKIQELPLYNDDLVNNSAVEEFCTELSKADALLFFSPEYNYSIPGPLKNAFDWASKHSKKPLANKPASIIGASPGAVGTLRMQYEFRKICVPLNMPVLAQPEVAVNFASEKIENSVLKDEATIERLKKHSIAFKDFIDKFQSP